jgi:hypothetical protein
MSIGTKVATLDQSERQDSVTRLRLLLPSSLAVIVLGCIVTTSLFGQSNIPSTKQPDIRTTSPALKKAVDELQRQCPTCASIDLASGEKTWVLTAPQARAQVVDLSDGCHVASWAHEQSEALRTTLEKAFTGEQLKDFHSNTPADCEQKAFVYYLAVARQLLGKAKPQ